MYFLVLVCEFWFWCFCFVKGLLFKIFLLFVFFDLMDLFFLEYFFWFFVELKLGWYFILVFFLINVFVDVFVGCGSVFGYLGWVIFDGRFYKVFFFDIFCIDELCEFEIIGNVLDFFCEVLLIIFFFFGFCNCFFFVFIGVCIEVLVFGFEFIFW